MAPELKTMGERRAPGDFILGTADSGLRVASSLIHSGSRQRIKDLASKISLSAAVLTQVGREVNRNADDFTDAFEAKFTSITSRCEKDYQTIGASIEKINSWTKDETRDDSEGPPKKTWKKLLWALGMNESEFDDLDNSLDETMEQAVLLQSIVKLLILQIHGKTRALTTSEEGCLRGFKESMGSLLEGLRDAKVASIMAFSLTETSKAVNTLQILEQAKSCVQEECSADDASTTIASITVRNYSEEVSTSLNKEQDAPIDVSPVMKEEPISPYEHTDIFEMHRASYNVQSITKQTLFRLFGMSFKVDRREKELMHWVEQVPATQEEIKSYLAKGKKLKTSAQPSDLETLMDLSPDISPAIYTLVNNKNDGKRYQSHTWSLEHMTSIEEKETPTRFRFWNRKVKKNIGYIVILKGEIIFRPGPPPPPQNWPRRHGGPPPPPPQTWPRRSPIVIIPRPRNSTYRAKDKIPGAQIELTQEETEQVINDFLASFSTLYDGIGVEDRGAVLKAITIKVEEENDDGYDSDDSSSSRSLIDD